MAATGLAVPHRLSARLTTDADPFSSNRYRLSTTRSVTTALV